MASEVKQFWEEAAHGEILEVSWKALRPAREGWSIRKSEDTESDNALVESIRLCGVSTPVKVSAIDGAIISGNRRYQAAKSAGVERLLAMVIKVPSEQHERYQYLNDNLGQRTLTQSEMLLATNERKKLHEQLFPETKAHVAGGLKRALDTTNDKLSLVSMKAFTEQESIRVGKSRRTIERELSIAAKAHETILKALDDETIDATKAYDLSRLDPSLQIEAFELVKSKEISSTKSKNLIEKFKKEKKGERQIYVIDDKAGPVEINNWIESITSKCKSTAEVLKKFSKESVASISVDPDKWGDLTKAVKALNSEAEVVNGAINPKVIAGKARVFRTQKTLNVEDSDVQSDETNATLHPEL
ncbi:MAG: ParB N-terminal domain-containing protein [Oligoflexia bacterium]|nr:ParB N-terminal domain-containing protein [Oligoflexia bacterium]